MATMTAPTTGSSREKAFLPTTAWPSERLLYRYYPIKFTITFRLSSEGDLHTEENTFFVHVVSKDKEDDLRDFDANDRTKARVIVDSYRTEPADVYAGEEFDLILSMKNASSAVPASNILFKS